MRYTVQSGKYIFKNFFYIIPFAIIPAFFLSLSTDEEAIHCVIETMFSGKIGEMHFVHIFRAISILSFSSWPSIGAGAAGLVTLVLGAAMMMALLEKHLRIGKRTYNGVVSKLNDNLLSTIWYGFLLFAIYELWTLIASGLLFVSTRIPVVPVAYTVVAIVFILMHIVLIYAIGLIYLWLPCMQITGFKAAEALNYSYQLMAPVKWQILFGQVFLLFFTEAIICVCAWFAEGFALFTALTTALYTFLIMIYCVRMQIAYFDRDHIERADNARYYRDY